MNRLMSVNKILSLIYYNQRSNLRKIINDWNFSHLTLGFIYKTGALVLLGLFLLLFAGSYVLTAFFIPEGQMTNFVSVLFTLFIGLSILKSFSFFSKHRNLFYLDTSKLLNRTKQIRVLQVVSFMLGNTVKYSLLTWMIFLAPLFLGAAIHHSEISWLLIVVYAPGYLFFNLFLLMFFTLLHYLFSKLFYANAIRYLNNGIVFIAASLLFFFIPYSVSSYFVNTDVFSERLRPFIENYQTVLSELGISPYLFTQVFFVESVLFTILLSIGSLVFLYLWFLLLRRFDLIDYYQINRVMSSEKDKTSILEAKHLFFIKDLLHIRRMNAWFIGHISKTIFGLLLFVGLVIPLIDHFIGVSESLFIIAISGLISIAIFQLVGDSLRMILAIDGEAKNAYLFINKSFRVYDLVKEKMYTYFIFVASISLLFLLIITFFLNADYSAVLISFLIIVTYGILSGLFQIATTGLYPRMNWEHYYEIGESNKASKINNLLNNALTVFYTIIIGLLFFGMQLWGLSLGFFTTVLVSAFVLFFFTFTYFTTVLYLKKVQLKEVFTNYD
ncbi:hypothetical protein [Halobacillus sp. B23F22_1]|uniref:hypothetical protein n=1 Tax=Halobacillus sp. B23F22_1 TaxID=3459514 RepID=UPI00373E89F3